MTMTDQAKKRVKLLGEAGVVLTIVGTLCGMAYSQGAQSIVTKQLDVRVTAIEKDGSPADRERDARIMTLLESIDARTKRIEDREDVDDADEQKRGHR